MDAKRLKYLTVFKTECEEHLRALGDHLLALERVPGDQAPLKHAMRVTHTLKGSAQLLGLAEISRDAHAIEDHLRRLERGEAQLDAELVDQILTVLDGIRGRVGGLLPDGSAAAGGAAASAAVASAPALAPAAATVNPLLLPGEYLAAGQTPKPWTVTDVIAEASLIGGIFGKGGGNEVGSALALQALERRFGQARGQRAWTDFREANDPEAPTTILHHRFPYETNNAFAKRGLALPDLQQAKSAVLSSLSPTSGQAPVRPCELDLAPGRCYITDRRSVCKWHVPAILLEPALSLSRSLAASSRPMDMTGPRSRPSSSKRKCRRALSTTIFPRRSSSSTR